MPVETTDGWSDTSGAITRLHVGGTNCYHMFGISYWTEEDGARLGQHRAGLQHARGHRRYWDQVALEYFVKAYKVAVGRAPEDIIEIDTYRELKNWIRLTQRNDPAPRSQARHFPGFSNEPGKQFCLPKFLFCVTIGRVPTDIM